MLNVLKISLLLSLPFAVTTPNIMPSHGVPLVLTAYIIYCYVDHNVLHFTAYTCIIIRISSWMSFFTGCVAQLTPSSHTGLTIYWYVLLLFGYTSQRYILAVTTELQLCFYNYVHNTQLVLDSLV